MAKYINPVATGLAIGQGEAQVFDTSGVWKAKLGAIKEAKLEKEKKEKELLDSLVDIDTSNVWSRDLGMYNEKWNNYNNFIKENFEKLKNPSKNVEAYTQKKRMEQEMMQFVSSSANAQKQNAEVKKLMLGNQKLYDKNDQISGWSGEAGNFTNPMDFVGTHATAFSEYVKKMKPTISTDINEKLPKGGYYVERAGTTDETWKQAWGDQYDTDPIMQQDAQIWWEQAGGAESGFDNPRDYMVNKSMEFKDVVSEKKTRIPTSGSGFDNRNAEIDAMYGVDLSTERMRDVAGTAVNTKSYTEMSYGAEPQTFREAGVMTIGGNPVKIEEGWKIERDETIMGGLGTAQWQIINADGKKEYEDLTKEEVQSLVSATTQEAVEGSYGEEATMALPSKFVNDRKVEYNAREFAPKGTEILDLEGNPVKGADASGAVHAKPVAVRMNTKTGKMEIIAEYYPNWADAENPTNPRNVQDKQTVVYDYESNKEFLNTNYPRIKENIQDKFSKWEVGTGGKYNKE